jgi:hypothetical protein
MKRSPYKHWEYKLQQEREKTRTRRMWDEAYAMCRRGPNKYSRVLTAVLGCFGGAALINVVLLCVLAAVFGVSAVSDAITSHDYVYGTLMRGMMVLIGVLFAAYLVAGWIED